MPHQIRNRLIGDPSKIKHVQWVSFEVSLNGSPMRHDGLQFGMSVVEEACRSRIWHVGLQSGMLQSPIRHDGLQWVSDNINIFANSILSTITDL